MPVNNTNNKSYHSNDSNENPNTLDDNSEIMSLDSGNVEYSNTDTLSDVTYATLSEDKQNIKKNSINGNGFFSDLNQAIKITPENKDLIVPYSQRQGLLSRFCLIQQFKDPLKYPKSVKVFLILICAIAAVVGPFQTSLIFPALTSIQEEYNTSATETNVSVGVYLLALGIFPIYHSSISELHGKRNVYVVSFFMLFIFCLLLCVACHTITAFIVLRFFCGVFSSSVQALGAGTLSDLYVPEQRGAMFGIFYLGSLLAPLLAPIVGALLCNSFDWKSTQWFMLIFSAAVMFLLILCLPETSTTYKDKEDSLKELIKEKKKQKQSNLENIKTYNPEGNLDGDLEVQNEVNEDKLASRILTREPSIMQYKKIPTGKPKPISNKEQKDNNDFEEDNFDTLAPALTRVKTTDTKPDTAESIKQEEAKELEQLQKINTIIDQHLDEFDKTGHFNEKIDYKLFLKLYLVKPLKMLYYLQHPPVLLSIIFSAISFGILYYVNLAIERCYSASPYNFKPLYVGLCYIPNSVTYIIASIFGGRYVDKRLVKYKEEHNGAIFPEARLSWNVFVAILLFPPALLIIGWCFDKKVMWVFPLIGTAIFGLASMLIIGATTSYLTDEVKGSRGVALNNFVRQTCAAIACFTSERATAAMSVGWVFTLLTFIIILASFSLALLKVKSQYFRDHFDLEKIKAKTEVL